MNMNDLIAFDSAGGRHSILGIFDTTTFVFKVDTYKDYINTFFDKISFEITVHVLRKNYVGEGTYHTAEARLDETERMEVHPAQGPNADGLALIAYLQSLGHALREGGSQ